MTYHAIPGIPKSTCTAEQKIAYNIAYNLYGTYSAQYIKRKDNVSGVAKSEFVHQLVHKGLNLYKLSRDYKPGKYDLDAIFCALNAGLANYFDASVHILTSYNQISDMFPALYLAEVAVREF